MFVVSLLSGKPELFGPYEDVTEIRNARPWAAVDSGVEGKDWFIVQNVKPEDMD